MIKKILLPLLFAPCSACIGVLSLQQTNKSTTAIRAGDTCDLDILQHTISMPNSYDCNDVKLPITLHTKQLVLSANNDSTVDGNKFMRYIENRYISRDEFFGMSYGIDNVKIQVDWFGNLLPKYLNLRQEEKPILFSENIANIFVNEKNVWGIKERIEDMHSDMVFTKDGDTPYVFTDMNELMTYCPKPISGILCNHPFNSIPLTYMQCTAYSVYSDNWHTYIKWLDTDTLRGQVKCFTYSLKDMFTTKYCDKETAVFGTTFSFRTDDYTNHKHFSDMVNNKMKMRLYYQTQDYNNPNKMINCIKEFNYTTITSDVDLDINNGVFKPLAIESLQYNDENIYIQGEYCSLE